MEARVFWLHHPRIHPCTPRSYADTCFVGRLQPLESALRAKEADLVQARRREQEHATELEALRGQVSELQRQEEVRKRELEGTQAEVIRLHGVLEALEMRAAGQVREISRLSQALNDQKQQHEERMEVTVAKQKKIVDQLWAECQVCTRCCLSPLLVGRLLFSVRPLSLSPLLARSLPPSLPLCPLPYLPYPPPPPHTLPFPHMGPF